THRRGHKLPSPCPLPPKRGKQDDQNDIPAPRGDPRPEPPPPPTPSWILPGRGPPPRSFTRRWPPISYQPAATAPPVGERLRPRQRGALRHRRVALPLVLLTSRAPAGLDLRLARLRGPFVGTRLCPPRTAGPGDAADPVAKADHPACRLPGQHSLELPAPR